MYGRILAPTLPDPCKAGYIPGGKLEKLVDHLVPALLFGDASFIPVFLGTYRTFSTTHQVLSLLFSRAFSFILGSWMKEYPEDFLQAQDAACLNQLVNYLQHNMPGSREERQACLLLAQREHMHPKQPELEAVPTVPALADNASAQEGALDALGPAPRWEDAILSSQSYLELSAAADPPSAPGPAVQLQCEPLEDGYSGCPAPSLMKPSAGGVTGSSVPGAPSPTAPTTSVPGTPAAGDAGGAAMPVSTAQSQLAQGKAEPSATCAAALEPCASRPLAAASYSTGREEPGDGRPDSAPGPGPCVEQEESCRLAGEAACLPPPEEEAEPSAREPLPAKLDAAPIPPAQLDMDATVQDPARPPAPEAAMPAHMAPAPWDILSLENYQCSSRGTSRISLRDFENALTQAHVLEWLPDLKAEQFCLMAVDLFKRLKPYHCLHYVRADRDDEQQERLAPTVLAILKHCDQVASCVTTTCLGDHSTQAAERAQVVEHWIEVALECHLLRNVCSLFPILTALQSSPVQGLRRTWRAVSRDSLQVFQELKKIFSTETIYKGRQSKYMTIWRKVRRGFKKPKELDYPEGTVPHLGAILTHLASLQMDRETKNGTWISMIQRREEFKVMSLIKELQGTCEELHVVPEVNFVAWFTNVKRLSDAESSKLSMELEPPRSAGLLTRNPKWSPLLRKPSRHLQAPSIRLSSHSSSALQTSDELSGGTGSPPPAVQPRCSPRPYSHCCRLYQSAPNIYGSKVVQDYDRILPFLSPQPFRRAGPEGIS